MTKVKRKNLDLLHVVWGEYDQGVVSLKQKHFLFYIWGDRFGGHHSLLPTVYIEDKDFGRIMEPIEDDPDCFEATWDDVPALLTHPTFPLMQRLDWNWPGDQWIVQSKVHAIVQGPGNGQIQRQLRRLRATSVSRTGTRGRASSHADHR